MRGKGSRDSERTKYYMDRGRNHARTLKIKGRSRFEVVHEHEHIIASANDGSHDEYTRWSIINRTGRPTYPLNSKSYPPATAPPCPRRHRHRNSLSFRENPLTTTPATRRFSLSPSPSSRRHLDPILFISHSRGRAILSLYSGYRSSLRIASSGAGRDVRR